MVALRSQFLVHDGLQRLINQLLGIPVVSLYYPLILDLIKSSGVSMDCYTKMLSVCSCEVALDS